MRRPLLLRGVHVVDVRQGALVRDQDVLCNGHGRIEAIGRGITATADIIEGAGRFVAPGLIDSHIHVLSPFLDRLPSAADLVWVPRQIERNLRTLARSGVTTIRDCMGPLHMSRWYRFRAQAGAPWPRLLVSGPMLTVHGGYPAFVPPAKGPQAWLSGPARIDLEDAHHAERTVDELAEAGVDLVKIGYSSVGYDDQHTPVQTPAAEVVTAITRRAHHHNLPVAVHHTWLHDLTKLCDLPFDTLEHLTWDAEIPDGVVKQLAARGTPVTSTIQVLSMLERLDEVIAGCDGDKFEPVPRRELLRIATQMRDGTFSSPYFGLRLLRLGSRLMRKNALKLVRAGVKVATATDAGGALSFMDGLPRELEHLVEAGFTPAEALRAATIDAAHVVGRPHDLGAIERGRAADFTMVDGNPLEDVRVLSTPSLVLRDGRVIYEGRGKSIAATAASPAPVAKAASGPASV